MTNAEGK